MDFNISEKMTSSVCIKTVTQYLRLFFLSDDCWNRDSVLRKMTGPCSGRRGRSRIYAFSKTSRSPLGPTHLGYGVLLWSVERPGREAEHSLSSNAEVKNEWSYTSTPPTCMACTGPTLLLLFARGAKSWAPDRRPD
jgi:hypothetical protein